MRLADAVKVFLDTIPATNTRRGYGIVLNRLIADFGADTNVALLVLEPDIPCAGCGTRDRCEQGRVHAGADEAVRAPSGGQPVYLPEAQ
ncbi:hypothetical protein [Nocardia sp. NPDC051463]|uniref:hypothetical protein n=1 Tax=Nocardia sp. NPDC051463 TaxID=3154845 RepID=UPI00344E66DA